MKMVNSENGELDPNQQGQSLTVGGLPVLSTINYNSSTAKELDVPSHHQLSIVTITPQLIRAVAVSVESNQYPSSDNFQPVDPTGPL